MGAVETTDAVYVTGSPADQGCKSLRDFVVALNGAAQIAAFRDTNILEAEAHWNDVISHARSYIKSYAGIINDFYDKSTQIFPLIEFEDVESCPVGTTKKPWIWNLKLSRVEGASADKGLDYRILRKSGAQTQIHHMKEMIYTLRRVL